jgi:hypothetical protein
LVYQGLEHLVPFFRNQELTPRSLTGQAWHIAANHDRRNHSTRLTFLSLQKSTLVESVLDPSA